MKHVSLVAVAGTLLLGMAARIFYWAGYERWMWVAVGIACLDAGGPLGIVWIPLAWGWGKLLGERRRE